MSFIHYNFFPIFFFLTWNIFNSKIYTSKICQTPRTIFNSITKEKLIYDLQRDLSSSYGLGLPFNFVNHLSELEAFGSSIKMKRKAWFGNKHQKKITPINKTLNNENCYTCFYKRLFVYPQKIPFQAIFLDEKNSTNNNSYKRSKNNYAYKPSPYKNKILKKKDQFLTLLNNNSSFKYYRYMKTENIIILNFMKHWNNIEKQRKITRFLLRTPIQKIYSLNKFQIPLCFSTNLRLNNIYRFNVLKRLKKIGYCVNPCFPISFCYNVPFLKIKSYNYSKYSYNYYTNKENSKVKFLPKKQINGFYLFSNLHSSPNVLSSKWQINNEYYGKTEFLKQLFFNMNYLNPIYRFAPKYETFTQQCVLKKKPSIYNDDISGIKFLPYGLKIYGGSWHFDNVIYLHSSWSNINEIIKLHNVQRKIYNNIIFSKNEKTSLIYLPHNYNNNLLRQWPGKRQWPGAYDYKFFFKYNATLPYYLLKYNNPLKYNIGIYSLAHKLASLKFYNNCHHDIYPFKYNDEIRYNFQTLHYNYLYTKQSDEDSCFHQFLNNRRWPVDYKKNQNFCYIYNNPIFSKFYAPFFKTLPIFYKSVNRLHSKENSDKTFHKPLHWNKTQNYEYLLSFVYQKIFPTQTTPYNDIKRWEKNYLRNKTTPYLPSFFNIKHKILLQNQAQRNELKIANSINSQPTHRLQKNINNYYSDDFLFVKKPSIFFSSSRVLDFFLYTNNSYVEFDQKKVHFYNTLKNKDVAWKHYYAPNHRLNVFNIKPLCTFINQNITYVMSQFMFKNSPRRPLSMFSQKSKQHSFVRSKYLDNHCNVKEEKYYSIFPTLFQPLTFRFVNLNLPRIWSYNKHCLKKPNLQNNIYDYQRFSPNGETQLVNFNENHIVVNQQHLLHSPISSFTNLAEENVHSSKKNETMKYTANGAYNFNKESLAYMKLCPYNINNENITPQLEYIKQKPFYKMRTIHGPSLKTQKESISLPNYLKTLTNNLYQNVCPNSIYDFYLLLWILFSKTLFIYLSLYYLKKFVAFLGTEYIRNLFKIFVTMKFIDGNVLSIIKTFQDFNYQLNQQNVIDIKVNKQLKTIKRIS